MAKSIRELLTTAALAAIMASSSVAQDVTPDRGAYLAGRYAMLTEDLSAAPDYFSRALAADPTRRPLQHDALAAFIGADLYDNALEMAQSIGANETRSQLSNSVKFVDLVRKEDWRGVLERLEAGFSAGPLLDSLLRAWAHYGSNNLDAAFSAFDEIIEDPQQRAFGQYHKALALALSGDFSSAEEILALPPSKGVPPTRQAVIMRVQVLSQLGQFSAASDVLGRSFGADSDIAISRIRQALAANEALPFNVVKSPVEGVAESFYSVAETVAQGNDSFVALLYARMTQWTNSTHEEALIASARLLGQMGQLDLSQRSYEEVPETASAYIDAQTGIAMILREKGQGAEAIALLQDLSSRYPQMPLLTATLADTLRAEGDFAASRAAYDRALELYPEEAPARWVLYFSRGVAAHEAGDLEASEADLRAALAINPRQASVLNYLGYSLIERQKDLDEALRMIEQAISLEPRSGAIIDSLGWAYYKLGRYEEAVVQLERAVTLEATSYEINDHLGDAYWMVGRKREAAFQWRRAASFAHTEKPDAVEGILAKLDNGLSVESPGQAN